MKVKIVIVGSGGGGKSTVIESYRGSNEFKMEGSSKGGGSSGNGNEKDGSFLVKDIKVGEVTVATEVVEVGYYAVCIVMSEYFN